MVGRFSLFLAAVLSFACAWQTHAQEVQRIREMIPGKLMRAGSSNKKPFSDATLAKLCEQGYTLAVYVYGGAVTHDVSCSRGKITYTSMTSWEKPQAIVDKARAAIQAGGKVMVHCWYGVHASNFATSVALKQMCGYTGAQAAATFKCGVPPKSLPQSRIDQLANEIANYGPTGSVMEGCRVPTNSCPSDLK